MRGQVLGLGGQVFGLGLGGQVLGLGLGLGLDPSGLGLGLGLGICGLDSKSVCLSRTYISGLSREQRSRPRKTKIGTEEAHVTRDSDTTFKVKRSRSPLTRPIWLAVLAGQH